MCTETIHLFCSIFLEGVCVCVVVVVGVGVGVGVVGAIGHMSEVLLSLSRMTHHSRYGSQGAGPGKPYVCGCQCPACVTRLATSLLPSWLSHSWLSRPSRVSSREGREGGCCGQRYLDVNVGRALPRVIVVQGHHSSRRHRVLSAASPVSLCSHHKKNTIMK